MNSTRLTFKMNKKGLRYLTIFVLCILKTSISISQSQDLYFNSVTVNEGLSQHDASSIIQDSNGFIWIGTYDGLNRFDGYKVVNYFAKFDDSESLSSNRIKSLFEDSKKRIWIGTDGSGINYYSLIKEKFIRIKTPDGCHIINDIIENESGELLIATNGGILKVIEAPELKVELKQLPLTGIHVNKIITDGKAFYFSTNKGVWVLENNVCTLIKETANTHCFNLAIDTGNNIFVGGDDGLRKISRVLNSYSVTKINALDGKQIMALCISKNGDIWLGTNNEGLIQMDSIGTRVKNIFKYNALQKRSIVSNAILDLFCDNSNTLWVANRQGISYTNLNPRKINTINSSNPNYRAINMRVGALHIENNNIFLGIKNGNYYKYNLDTKQIHKIEIDGFNLPIQIKKLNGKIYLSGDNGLFLLNEENNFFSKVNTNALQYKNQEKRITAMCVDAFGNEYYGTWGGLLIKKNTKFEWLHDIYDQGQLLKDKRIFSLIYDDSNSCIWVGTVSNGLYKINLIQSGVIKSVEIYKQEIDGDYHIFDNTIWCFYIDAKNTLWVGSDMGLFYKIAGNNKFQLVKTNGVINKKIMAIQADFEEKLWLNNSQGLICYDPKNASVLKYSYNDGLNSNALTEAAGISTDGTMFVGTISGVNFFNPKDTNENTYPVNVSFTNFKVHNKEVLPGKPDNILNKSINLTKKITLNHLQNNFLIEFSGTNYSNARDNEFRYKLVNHNSDNDTWTYVESKYRLAQYSNLKAGNYTFYVQAKNHDGIWGKNIKTLTIQIKTAPWLSWWAYMIYIIIVIFIILMFLYFFTNRQKLNHQIKLDQTFLKQEKEINELKLTFFTDVAHEFKTPLSLILGPLNDLIKNDINKKQADFCFHVISRNTQRMMLLVDQFLDFRKINANLNILKVDLNDLSSFIISISNAFLWEAENNNINFKVIVPGSFQCYFDEDILEKVLYNFFSNAFKYTPKNGSIELELKSVWNEGIEVAIITIKDSGIGIPNENKKEIFNRFFHGKERSSSGIGLHLTSNLVKAHKGKINVSDSSFGGTEFIISLPVSKHVFNKIEFKEFNNKKEINYDLLKTKKHTNAIDKSNQDKILIVEDDHDLRFYLKNCFEDKFNIIDASNGKIGVELAKKENPDLIISDLMMPEMDGIEMSKILKEDAKTSHIPIILLTAKTDEKFLKIGLETGAVDYIFKPFNSDAIIKKVENIISMKNNFKKLLDTNHIKINHNKKYNPFDQKLILKATKIIEENMNNTAFSAKELALELGISRMQLHRKVKDLLGQTTTVYINSIKMKLAAKMFEEGCDRVQEAMDAVGIQSYSHFNTTFKSFYNIPPSEFIKKEPK